MSVNNNHTRRRILKAVGGATGAAGIAGCLGRGGQQGGQTTTTTTTMSGGGPSAQLIFGGGEQASTAYQMGVGWGQLIKKKTNGRITINTQTSGGDEIEFRGVAEGTFDLATGTTPDFWRADKGVKPFGEKIDINICFTWYTTPFPLGFTVTDNENIDYLEDFEGKTLATGVPGSVGHFYWTMYCKANDIDLKSMSFERVPTDEGLRLVNQGRVDGVISGAANDSPPPAVNKWLTRTDKAKLVPPKKGERSIALGEYVGGGVVWNLALKNFGKAWKNSAVSDQDHVQMIAGTGTLFSDLHVSDAVIYEITKTTIENRKRLIDFHALWSGFANKPEKYLMAMTMKDAKHSPWHPGAAKAIKEAGYWSKDFPIAKREE